MIRKLGVALLLTGLTWTVGAALGPTDGEGLPPTELGRVAVGDPAPDFSLKRSDDSVVTLSHYRDKQDVILVFYRGHW